MFHNLEIDASFESAFHALMKRRPFPQYGKRLSAMRQALGLSQAELCRAIGVSANRWNQYEKGERKITVEIAIKLQRKFGITLDWVYLGDPNMLPAILERLLPPQD
jgi:transcriptional regulator with XRE-family HTH domain